jgi:hypothetical protein
MKKYIFISLLSVLLIGQHQLQAQQAGKRISHTTVAIYNNSDKNLNIRIGPNEQNLQTYMIMSQEKWIGPTFPLNSKPLFRIKTDQKETKYTLRLNKTYMIFWNTKKKSWDLKSVKNEE